MRAVGPDGESADSPVARITTPPSRAFEIGPYLQQLTPTARGGRVADLRARHDRAPLRPGGRPACGRRARRRADPPPRGSRCAGCSPEPTYALPVGVRRQARAAVRAFARPSPGPDRFSFGVIGDFGIGTPAARANLRRLSADPASTSRSRPATTRRSTAPRRSTGDFVLGPLRDLIATKPFWPSVGNHDYYNLQNYLRFFALPNGGLHYSFTYGGVLFLVARLEPLRRAAAAMAAGASCAARPRAARSPTSTIRCGRAGAGIAATRATCGAHASSRSCSGAASTSCSTATCRTTSAPSRCARAAAAGAASCTS